MNYSYFNQSENIDALINDAYKTMHLLHRQLVNVPGRKIVHHQLAILTLLAQEGPLPTSEIAKRLSLTKPQMTQFIDGLVEDKAVERKDDPTDRRRILINITDSGKSSLSDYYNLVRKNVIEKFKNLEPEQITVLAKALAQIASLSQKLG